MVITTKEIIGNFTAKYSKPKTVSLQKHVSCKHVRKKCSNQNTDGSVNRLASNLVILNQAHRVAWLIGQEKILK